MEIEKPNNFRKLPEKLIRYIVSCLELKDFALFSATNKKHYYILKNYEQYYYKQCYLLFTSSSSFELFCEFSDNDKFMDVYTTKNNLIYDKISNGIVWKDILKNVYKNKRDWIDLLNTFSPNINHNKEFINSLYLSLKDPSLPKLKLRRENVGNYTKTSFQNLLVDVLYDPDQIRHRYIPYSFDIFQLLVGLFDGNDENEMEEKNYDKDFMNKSKNLEEIIEKKNIDWNLSKEGILSQDRKDLLNARWNIFNEESENFLHDTEEILKKKDLEYEKFKKNFVSNNGLLKIYDLIYQTVDIYTEFIVEILKYQDNAYDFLLEYTNKVEILKIFYLVDYFFGHNART